MKLIKNLKISGKLVVSYLFACVIPLILISTVIYRFCAGSLEQTSMEFASAFSSQVVADMDELIDEYDRLTKSVLVDSEIIQRLSGIEEKSVVEQMNQQLEMRKIMMRLTILKPEIKSVCLLMDDKQFYQFNSEGNVIDQNILSRQLWVEELRDREENIALTAVHRCSYYSRNQDGIVFTVGRKIRNQNGVCVGMILIDLDPAGLINLSEGFLLARNQYNMKVCIMTDENRVLYDSDVASGQINWSDAMEGDMLLYQKNEKDYIVLGNSTKKAGLTVYAVIPRSGLLFEINRIAHVTAFSVIGCTLVVLGISVLLSRTITRPIRSLQNRMQEMEQGEYRILEGGETGDEIGGLVLSYNHMVIRIKTLIEKVYLGEIKQKNAQYLALQTQINPHMLYNTLESIRMKALRSGADEVAEMVKLLARMFRTALNGQSSGHTIRDETEYAQDYIRLQNLRFRDMFSLHVDMEDGLWEIPVIPLIFQPVIENSIEHGFRGRNHPLHITLQGKQAEGGDILFYICDDGKGISPERLRAVNEKLTEGMAVPEIDEAKTEKTEVREEEAEETSIGLKNIAERLKLQYGRSCYLRLFERKEGGMGVEIRICPDKESGVL